MAQLILYACPLGLLATQIEAYYAKSKSLIGANKAHDYMPHCTLTGFFHDQQGAIPVYRQALAEALAQHQPTQPELVIAIKTLAFSPTWHGLTLQAPWLQGLVMTFAALANSPTRQAPLRLKDGLHLSLAYGFVPDQHQPLQSLAEQLINLDSPVRWELRFYERQPNNQWIDHWQRALC